MVSTEAGGRGSPVVGDPGSRAGLEPEARLLLATAGGEAFDPAIGSLAAGPLDWERFLLLTAQERAEAVVAARLRRLGIAPPDPVREVLQALALRSDLRMAMLDQRLNQTLGALAEAGIPVLLLKGAALGRTLYGSLPRRPMLDLDLLVPADRGREARKVALARGWVPGEMEHKAAFYQGHYHLPPLHDEQGRNFNLEIHVALFPQGHPFAWPVDAIWNRSQPLADRMARVPAMEDLLLHVSLHFMWSHAGEFGPWRAFRDVRMIAEAPGLDWDVFARQARETRGATAAYWTLRLARLLVGAPVPPSVEAALAPALPGAARTMLERHFTGQWFSAVGSCPSRRLARLLWRMGVQPRASGHRGALPWDREALFRPSGVFAVPGGTGSKFLSHFRNRGRYLRYLRRLTLGDA